MSFSASSSRHALRLLLLLAGLYACFASPDAFVSGLPGPGLWPRLAGAGLALAALLMPGGKEGRKGPAPEEKKGALGLVAACLVWILTLPLAGWMPACVLAAFTACRSGGCSLKESLALPLLLTLVLWLGMERLLHWSMPQGLLFSAGGF